MQGEYFVGGYVKLAKLWQKHALEAAEYHRTYYVSKFSGIRGMILQDVYIDITGRKEIYGRPEMLRLLRDCQTGRINCIAVQTKAYLAANTEDFFFVIHFLFNLPHRIDLITEDTDYSINTIRNAENQTEALRQAAEKYTAIEPARYSTWYRHVTDGIHALAYPSEATYE